MSRTRRQFAAPADLWDVVDGWADREMDPVALRARWSGRTGPPRISGPYLDVLDAEGARTAVGVLRSNGVRARRLRRPAGSANVLAFDLAGPARDQMCELLAGKGIGHRAVDEARRYAWRGPGVGPTFVDIARSGGDASVEAWHEATWWSGMRTERPRRVQQAVAAANRLLDRFDQPRITTA